MEILVVAAAMFIAGLVQTVSGFGGSLTIMMVLPTIMSLNDAVTLNQTVMIILVFMLVASYWRAIEFRKAVLPTVFCILFTTIFTDLALMVNVTTMKLLFGLFLIGVSIYFWLFSGKVRSSSNPLMACVCGSLSGITNGLFGIGGPPIAVYYLAVTDSKDAYIGTTQLVFFLTTIYTVLFRISKGLFCDDFWQYAVLGTVSILLGMLFGKKINRRISPEAMKKCVYVCLCVTGVNTVIQSL